MCTTDKYSNSEFEKVNSIISQFIEGGSGIIRDQRIQSKYGQQQKGVQQEF